MIYLVFTKIFIFFMIDDCCMLVDMHGEYSWLYLYEHHACIAYLADSEYH